MKRGYVRQTPHWSAEVQHKMLTDVGVKTIYREEKGKPELPERANVIKSLRRGDQLVVTGLARLAVSRADLLDVLAEIEARGAVIVDTKGRMATPHSAAMVTEAVNEWSGEKRMPSKKEASKRGKLGGRPVKVPDMGKHEALVIWRNPELTAEQALLQMTGWTKASAHRKLGNRFLLKGRFPKPTKK